MGTVSAPGVERPKVCALRGFAGVACGEPVDWHHVIGRGMARGNRAVRARLECAPDELMAPVCATHNRQRWADSREARRILLLANAEYFGIERVRRAVEGLPWKVRRFEMTWEGLTGGCSE